MQDQWLRARGVDTDDEDASVERDEHSGRPADLFHDEEDRREARRPRER
ncbi:hypothetical protein ABZ545_25175 [Streptomyces abikoensis]|uniref:Uncharacterized protein n=1 Tax=Streptomyces abikoensis TaxID=97398 RepID=A0ABW7TAT5_9ACTN